MEDVDTLIHARWLVPVEPSDTILEHHSIAIRDGRILAVLPQAESRQRYRSDAEHRLDHHLLIPGLINAHTHTPMTLLRGLADDMPFEQWLFKHIWPVEQKLVSAEFVHDGTLLAIAEMLRGGVTCFNDMYFFPEVTARAAAGAGMRASVGLIVVDFPSAWAGSPDEYLEKGLELHDEYRSDPLITTAFAPHAPYSVSEAPLRRIQTYVNELDIPIHMHVHETAREVKESVQSTGMRPIARLESLGMLSPNLVAVHATQLTDDEIALLAERGVHVVHCPESNLKLASGFCPVQRLLDAGVAVTLGTDGAASNNDLDMVGEMRTAALLGKAVAGDAAALPAERVLRMATLDAARALGIHELTGSLSPGKAADIAAIDLRGPETEPVYQVISQLVYATGRDRVSDVWVYGEHVVGNGQLMTLDVDEILERARLWGEHISRQDRAES